MKIEELDLDVRQYNMLKRAGIDTTEDFINYPDKERLKRLTGRTYGVMEELLKVGKCFFLTAHQLHHALHIVWNEPSLLI